MTLPSYSLPSLIRSSGGHFANQLLGLLAARSEPYLRSSLRCTLKAPVNLFFGVTAGVSVSLLYQTYQFVLLAADLVR
jgi:hypothetical protein